MDLISKSKLIGEINKIPYEGLFSENMKHKILNKIVGMPAEQVRGKWIADDYFYFRCSVCGCEQDSPEYTTPYCPKCGAKMNE